MFELLPSKKTTWMPMMMSVFDIALDVSEQISQNRYKREKLGLVETYSIAL
jgi:hypothetical protein